MKKNNLLVLFCLLTFLASAQNTGDFYFNVISPSSVYQTYSPGDYSTVADGWGWLGILETDIVTELVYADDGSGSPHEYCEGGTEDYNGKIVLIERGLCEFGQKALNAQNAGALGVIIKNLEDFGDDLVTLGAGQFGAEVSIPVIFIGHSIGAGLIAELNAGTTVLVGFTHTPNPIARIDGTVQWDENLDCVGDSNEPTLEDWKVQVNGDGFSVFGITDETGHYQIFVDTGAYSISLSPPNLLWTACLGEEHSFSTYDSVTVDLQAQAVMSCPAMSVDIEIPFLRRCFDTNKYRVQYCNLGTTTGEDAFVVVELDDLLTVVESSLSYTELPDNTFQFDLGDVEPGECGQFTITVEVSCDADFEQALCAIATIFPDTICIPTGVPYTGPDLRLDGQCNGDNLELSIRNEGENMTSPSNYRVLKDGVAIETGDFQLSAGATEVLTFAADGATYRLEAEQIDDFPYETNLSSTVEACDNGSGNFSVGFFTMFPPADYGLPYDKECSEVIGAYDPNDKTPSPKGFGEEHFIEKNTDIHYLIRFQNTGTDTAFNIVVRDTLTELLQPTSVKLGTSSHDYDLKFIDGNILEFSFENIMLPDSNINEPLSHGFLTFTIAQKPNLANGNVIKNSAAIYFDFNEPVITNETFLTIGENFVSTGIFNPPDFQTIPIEVFPNPGILQTRFDLKDAVFEEGRLEIFDSQGKQWGTQIFSNRFFDFKRGQLPSGIYFYKIELDGQVAAWGKLIFE